MVWTEPELLKEAQFELDGVTDAYLKIAEEVVDSPYHSSHYPPKKSAPLFLWCTDRFDK